MGAELPASPLVLTTAAAVPATSLYDIILFVNKPKEYLFLKVERCVITVECKGLS
jgi:hypothetical protein